MIITATISGVPQSLKAFEQMKRATKSRICRKAMRPALAPQLAAARRTSLFVNRSGALRKSLGSTIRTYRTNGITVGHVGPRTEYTKTSGPSRNITMAAGKRTVYRPARYARLVEHGHRSRGGGFVAGRPFLLRSFQGAKSHSLERFSSKFAVETMAEAAAAANKV